MRFVLSPSNLLVKALLTLVLLAKGKFWIRYKRNRPCEYMTSADRHRELMAQEEEAERLAAEAHKHSRKKSAPAKHSQQVSAVTHTARQGTPMSDMSSMRDSSPDEVKPPKVTKSHTNSVSTADKAAYVPGHASQSSASSSAAPLANTTPNRPQPSTGSKLVGPASALPPHMAPRSVSSSSLSGGAPARTVSIHYLCSVYEVLARLTCASNSNNTLRNGLSKPTAHYMRNTQKTLSKSSLSTNQRLSKEDSQQ